MIATDTPERLELINRSSKKLKVCPKEKVKKKLFVNEEAEECDLEENECDMELQKLSDEEDYVSDDRDNFNFENLDRMQIPDEYVLVEFKGKQKVYYVGKILSRQSEFDFEITFLRRSVKSGKFIMPDVVDTSLVHKNDIKLILPPPETQGKTKRQQGLLKFGINFDSLNVKQN